MADNKIDRGNMECWAARAKEAGYWQLETGQLSSLERFVQVRERGLPTHDPVVTDLISFLEQPEVFLRDSKIQPTPSIWISLVPKGNDKKLQRFTLFDVERTDLTISDQIRKKISTDHIHSYSAVLIPLYQDSDKLSGNAIFFDNGEVIIECHKGEHRDISRGTIDSRQLLHLKRQIDPFREGKFLPLEWGFKDMALREIIFSQIYQRILHSAQDREMEATGYYEFVIVKKQPEARPESIFLDYTNDKFFTRNVTSASHAIAQRVKNNLDYGE